MWRGAQSYNVYCVLVEQREWKVREVVYSEVDRTVSQSASERVGKNVSVCIDANYRSITEGAHHFVKGIEAVGRFRWRKISTATVYNLERKRGVLGLSQYCV